MKLTIWAAMALLGLAMAFAVPDLCQKAAAAPGNAGQFFESHHRERFEG